MVQPPFTQNELPSVTYTTALHAATAESARRRRQHVLFGYVRLAWAAAFIALLWHVFDRHQLSWPYLLLPWAGFAITAHFHAQVVAAGARSRRAIAWNEAAQARIEDRWSGLRPRATPPAAEASLYARDLDLFGAGRVFELLCSSRTTLGEEALATFLLAPADLEEVSARQVAVAELCAKTALREELWSAAGPDLLPVDRPALTAWARAKDVALPSASRWLAPLLAVFFLVSLARWATSGASLLLVIAIVLNGSTTYLLKARLKPLFATVGTTAKSLGALSGLLTVLEAQRFEAPRLGSLHNALSFTPDKASRVPASAAVRTLARLAAAVELRGNLFMRLLDLSLLYSVQLGWLVERWRGQFATELPHLLEAVGEFEALLSLSAYHFEHPSDGFPELDHAQPVFRAEALGHPLLPVTACVRNSISLDVETRLLLVSGSNMSGKSTLLRSVGVATAMALAGAPVRTAKLRIGYLHLAASIQVSDSLQAGQSRFYAEILRLRAVCELARLHPPVLFLLDELLAGTNSHDRVEGAAGVITQLLSAGALGVLSTHDLALTTISETASHLIRNAHFEDHIEGSGMHFDYTLLEGVVTRSNGLALMRMIGLDV